MPRTKYQSDGGQIYQIQMTAAKIALAGDAPVGDVTSIVKAKVSKSNREYGIRPRGVRIARELGTAPDTFVKYAFLPALTPEANSRTEFALGASITYNGFTWEVIAKVSEDS